MGGWGVKTNPPGPYITRYSQYILCIPKRLAIGCQAIYYKAARCRLRDSLGYIIKELGTGSGIPEHNEGARYWLGDSL